LRTARPAQKLAKERLDAIAKEEERLAAIARSQPRPKSPVVETLAAARTIPSEIRDALDHRGHVLLIGVSDYKTGCPALPNVVNDLSDLKKGLEPYFDTVKSSSIQPCQSSGSG